MGENEKTPSARAFPWREFLTFLGLVLTAYLGYLGIRSGIEIPIQATQTVEAKLALTVDTKMIQPLNILIQETPTYAETPTATPTVFACQKAPNVRVKVGDMAKVIQATTRLRSKPEVNDNNIIFLLAERDELEIVDGPICSPRPGRSDFYVFWKVIVPSRSLEGWVAEGDSNYYYIESHQ